MYIIITSRRVMRLAHALQFTVGILLYTVLYIVYTYVDPLLFVCTSRDETYLFFHLYSHIDFAVYFFAFAKKKKKNRSDNNIIPYSKHNAHKGILLLLYYIYVFE